MGFTKIDMNELPDALALDNPKKLYMKGKYLKKISKKDTNFEESNYKASKSIRKAQKSLSKMRKAA